MIIDMHHHMLPLTLDEKAIDAESRSRYYAYGKGARAGGVNLSTQDIKKTLMSFAPDPHGKKLIQRMKKAGIDITILCVVDNIDLTPTDEEAFKQNRICAGIAKENKGKIMAIAGVDPRRKKAPEILRRCIKEFGMIGLKWHPDQGYFPNSKESYAVLEVAEKLGVPLLTHTGPLPGAPNPKNQRRAKYVEPIYLDDVTQDFPKLKVVAAHMGRFLWREWAELAQFRPNLYGDLAMWQVFAVTAYERFCHDMRDILDIAGAGSVLYGSDGLGFSALVPNGEFIQILKGLPKKKPFGLKFTEKEIDAILGENARKVFGI